MKKTIAILAFGISSLFAECTTTKINKLIPALITQESKGNNKAIGDKGKALGCLQVWKVVVADVNKNFKKSYKHKDMFNRNKSIDVCSKYLQHYGKVYEQKTGQKPSKEVLARIWNGGPDGYSKEVTKKYWENVEKLLQNSKRNV